MKLLILAGGGFEEFKPAARELGIADKLVVRRDVVDIENYVHAADAGIYTSEKESFGMGVLETMSFGKPVVATGVGGVPEIMSGRQDRVPDQAGRRAGDGQGRAQAGRRPGARGSHGASRSGRAQQEFSAQKSVDRYLD